MIAGRGGATAWAALGMIVLPACQTWAGRRDAPAVITAPTAGSRVELQRAVSLALNGAAVTIADDALTRDDALVVERAPARDPEGRPLTGRETGRPEHFRLVTNGGRCVLVHEGSGRRFTLAATTCSPVPGAGEGPPQGPR